MPRKRWALPAMGPKCALCWHLVALAGANSCTTSGGPRWPFGQTSPKNIACGTASFTMTAMPITFATETDCPPFQVRDDGVYSKAASINVATRGCVHGSGKSYPRNGNLIDLANASHFAQSPEANNAYNASSAFPFYYADGAVYLVEDGISYECAGIDPETFRYLPFWASEAFEVPFCVYRYDATETSARKRAPAYTATFKRMPSNDQIDRGYYDNVSIAEHTFSSAMNMEPPLTCSSTDTMCLPGRCGMLDTNYLFRLSDRTDTVFEFMSDFDPSSSEGITKAYIAVYGKAQCDPMYGGGLQDYQNPDVIKYPPNGNFDSAVWRRYADGYEAYTTDALDNLFTETGSVLGLPTYGFASWDRIGRINPNPMWFYKSKAAWHDGDPVGIRRYGRLGVREDDMPNCSDFGAYVPLSDAAEGAFSDNIKDLMSNKAARNTDPSNQATLDQVKKSFEAALPKTPTQFYVLPLNVYQTISKELGGGDVELFNIAANQGTRYSAKDLEAGPDVVIMPWLSEAALNKNDANLQQKLDSFCDTTNASYANCVQMTSINALSRPSNCYNGGTDYMEANRVINVTRYRYPVLSSQLYERPTDGIEVLYSEMTSTDTADYINCALLDGIEGTETPPSTSTRLTKVDVHTSVLRVMRRSDPSLQVGIQGGFLWQLTTENNVKTTQDMCRTWTTELSNAVIRSGNITEHQGNPGSDDFVKYIGQQKYYINIPADPDGIALCYPQTPWKVSFFTDKESIFFDYYTYPAYYNYGTDTTKSAQLRLFSLKPLAEWNPTKESVGLSKSPRSNTAASRPVWDNFNVWVNEIPVQKQATIPFWEGVDALHTKRYNVSSATNGKDGWKSGWNLYEYDEAAQYADNDFYSLSAGHWTPRVLTNAVLSPYITNQTVDNKFNFASCDNLSFVDMTALNNTATAYEEPTFKNTELYRACVAYGYGVPDLWDKPSLSNVASLNAMACPVTAGCLLRPIGETGANTFPDASDSTRTGAAFVFPQSTSSLQCLPMWKQFQWDEWPGKGARSAAEKDKIYYAVDPGTYLTRLQFSDALWSLNAIEFYRATSERPVVVNQELGVTFFRGQIYEQKRTMTVNGGAISTVYGYLNMPVVMDKRGSTFCQNKIEDAATFDDPLAAASFGLVIAGYVSEEYSSLDEEQSECVSIDSSSAQGSFFKQQLQYGNRHRYDTDDGAPDVAMYYERMELEPFTILPRTTSAIKTVPVSESHFSTQFTQNFADPKSISCDCGGAGGIKFYFESTPLLQIEASASGNFQDGVTALFDKVPALKAVRAQLGYRKSGYSWNILFENTPRIGIPIVSRSDFTLVERDILRDPTLSKVTLGELFGSESGQPDWTQKPLRDRYWFTDSTASLANTDLTRLWANVYSTAELESDNAVHDLVITNDDIASSDVVVMDEAFSGNDVVCPTGSIGGTPTTPVLEGTCFCATADCVNAYGCPQINLANYRGLSVSPAQRSLIDAFVNVPNQKKVLYVYSRQNKASAFPDLGITLRCYPTYEHAYAFKTSCLRYPYGMVQSWELTDTDRNVFYPPPSSLMQYTYNYCEDVSGKKPYDPLFMDCANDHLSYAQRKSFCDPTRNPLVTRVSETLVILERPLSSVCSARLKACLLVPGSAQYGSFAALVNSDDIDLTDYTVLVAPVTDAFVRRAQINTWYTDPSNGAPTPTKSTDDTEALGFSIDRTAFAILANVDAAADIATVTASMTDLAASLRAVPPFAFCPPNQERMMAESNSELAYECVEKGWWGYPYLNASDVLVRSPGMVVQPADTNTPLRFRRVCSKCTVFQVGAPGFQLQSAVFENGPDPRCCAQGEPVVVFSGASAAESALRIVLEGVTGIGAAVHYLGYDGQFFGSHPLINVSGSALDVSLTGGSTAQFSAGFARAIGAVRVTSTPPLKVLVQSVHPTHQADQLVVAGSAMLNISDFIDIFGNAAERNLFDRPADHTATLLVTLVIACFSSVMAAGKGFAGGACRRNKERARIERALHEARLQHPHHVNFAKELKAYAHNEPIKIDPPRHPVFSIHRHTILFKTNDPHDISTQKYYDAVHLLHRALKHTRRDNGVNPYLAGRLDDDRYRIAETVLERAESFRR